MLSFVWCAGLITNRSLTKKMATIIPSNCSDKKFTHLENHSKTDSTLKTFFLSEIWRDFRSLQIITLLYGHGARFVWRISVVSVISHKNKKYKEESHLIRLVEFMPGCPIHRYIYICIYSFTNNLPPIIMEVENGSIQDDRFLYNTAIFHFHDYGRKGNIL